MAETILITYHRCVVENSLRRFSGPRTSLQGQPATVAKRSKLDLPSPERRSPCTPPNFPAPPRIPWNKGRLTGEKPTLKLKETWAIRTRLQNVRERAGVGAIQLGNRQQAARLQSDLSAGPGHIPRGHVAARATVTQQKTHRPVPFEISERTRESVDAWIRLRGLRPSEYLFPSRLPRLGASFDAAVCPASSPMDPSIGLDDSAYAHTPCGERRLRWSTGERRICAPYSCVLGHTKIESTVRYLGIEVDDALEMAEQTKLNENHGWQAGACQP